MNTQELVGAVLAMPYARQQQQVLREYLQAGYAEARSVPDPDAQRRALVRHIEHAKECLCCLGDPQIVARAREAAPAPPPTLDAQALGPAVRDLDDIALTMHQLQLVQSGIAGLFSMLKQVRYRHRHRTARRVYRDEDCGNYPFRDASHPEVHVRWATPTSKPAHSGRVYSYADVEPFTLPSVSKRTRAALYRSLLEARTLTLHDVKGPHEHALVGQRGVFATTVIQPGTCLGVYGGQVMDEADIFLVQDDRYLINAAERVGAIGINGENLMSLTNTLFKLDDEGKTCGHQVDGYNLEAAQFDVELQHGWKLFIHAFFALKEIRPGEELRWNYQLGGC